MAAWVIPITGKLPKHWKIAQENRFWDMTKSFGIKNGDDVFFWIGAPKKGKNLMLASLAGPPQSRMKPISAIRQSLGPIRSPVTVDDSIFV